MSINSFNQYTSFLIDECMEDLCKIHLQKIEESKYNTQVNKVVPKEELLSYIKDEILNFLQSLKKDHMNKFIVGWIQQFKKGKNKIIPTPITKGKDAIAIFHFKKYLFLSFLSNYTSDINKAIFIINHLEDLFINLETTIIEYFDNSEFYNKKLKEYEVCISQSELSGHIGHCEFNFITEDLSCSEEFYNIMGLRKNETLTLKKLQSLAIVTNGYKPFSKDSQVYKSGIPNHHEFQLQFSENDLKTIAIDDFPLVNNNGEIIGTRSFIQDITQLKQKEVGINESKKQLQKIIDFSPTFISIYDMETEKMIFVNNSTFSDIREKLYQTKYIDFIKDYMHPDDMPATERRVKSWSNLGDNEYSSSEFRVYDLNGNLGWRYSRALVFKRENGKVKQILSNTIDITDLKKAEEKLKYKEEQLLEAQAIAHTGSYDWDLKSDAVTITKEICRIYGFPLDKETMTYKEFQSLLKPEYKTKSTNAMQAIFNGDFSGSENEYEIELANKQEKTIAVRYKVQTDSNGKANRILGTVMDITSLKRTEKELRKREAQLIETQKIAHVGSYEWDIINDKVNGTDELLRIFNLPQQQGLRIEDFKKVFTKEEEIVKLEQTLQRALKTSDLIEVEYLLEFSPNIEKYILVRSQTLFNENNDPIKMLGSVTDITTIKQIAKELQKKNKEITSAYNELSKTQEELKTINLELEERVKSRTKELKESKELYQTFIKQNTVGVWRFEFKDIEYVNTNLPVDEQANLIYKC